jgi:transposase-like protein
MAAKTKTAKRTSKTKKGKRYSDQERLEIIGYVQEVNAQRGRGGLSAASKKFNVSPLSIGNWIRKGGGGGIAPARTRGPGRKAKAGGGVWDQMVTHKAVMDESEQDLARKRAAFDARK